MLVRQRVPLRRKSARFFQSVLGVAIKNFHPSSSHAGRGLLIRLSTSGSFCGL